ncbi:MAG: DUF1573 domain-containing protein [Verrucomicrobium sp.]|nr:DUF1573 domain-containing protein [Verrucomicrobium sp.]
MHAVRTFLLLVFLSSGLRAGLAVDNEPVELKPRPEDDEVEKTFTFQNTGDKPIQIIRLESTCSCLEASLDKAVYAPGEKGTGKAKFKVSSFVGRHEKALHIHTNDPVEPDRVVSFVLDVPEVVSIEPKLLEWTVGEAPEAKKFVVKMTGEDPMKILKLSATRQNVTFESKEIKPGREYEISMKPASTAEVTIGALKIETDSKIPKYARQMAFFNIVRPELAEKKKAAAAAAATDKKP